MSNTHTEGNKYDKTHFLLQMLGLFASYDSLDDSDDICDLKYSIKCPRNFRPSPWILPPNYITHGLVYKKENVTNNRRLICNGKKIDLNQAPTGYCHSAV